MSYIISVISIIVLATAAWYVTKTFTPDWFQRFRMVIATTCVGIVLVVSVVNMPHSVQTGHVGIVYTFGAITSQREEGLQWTAPWQNLKPASIQVQGHKFQKLSSFSKETQDVFVDATVNVRVSPGAIQALYREVGPGYFDILIQPRVLQAFKDETVKYSSVDIAPHRETIRKVVRERLTNELKAHSITVQDLLIDNISFQTGFQNSIEKKQQNTQLSLAEDALIPAKIAQAQQKIEEARGTAEAILIRAQKQAEANERLARSISPQLVQYMLAEKLSPNVSVMMVPANQPFILGADMLKQPTSK